MTPPEIARLIKALGEEDYEHRQQARAALVARGVDALSALEQLMSVGDDRGRLEAVTAMGEIGDRRSVPWLVAALQDGPRPLKQWASIGLGRIGGDAAVSALLKALRDPEAEQMAVEALGEAGGERGISAVEGVMQRALAREDLPSLMTVFRACMALRKLGATTLRLQEGFRRVVATDFPPAMHTWPGFRVRALDALVDMGAMPLEDLRQLLADKSYMVRYSAARALALAGDASAETRRALEDAAVRHPDARVREEASRLVRELDAARQVE